jgi:predicted DNA-binding protein (MmcQ/YjbR family)
VRGQPRTPVEHQTAFVDIPAHRESREEPMSLFDQNEYERFLRKETGVTFVDQWGSHVAKVGDKVFTLLTTGMHDDIPRIVFKVTEETFEILTSMDGIAQARYFAKRKWVSVSEKADLPENDLKTYLMRSYRTVAKGLTKKLRTELGIGVD